MKFLEVVILILILIGICTLGMKIGWDVRGADCEAQRQIQEERHLQKIHWWQECTVQSLHTTLIPGRELVVHECPRGLFDPQLGREGTASEQQGRKFIP